MSYITYDCLYAYLVDEGKETGGPYIRNYHLIPYCRRPDDDDDDDDDKELESLSYLNYENVLYALTFDELKKRNITSEHLLTWFTPIDLAEKYEMNDNILNMVYKCKSPWFGTKCQYKLDYGESSSFNDIVQVTFSDDTLLMTNVTNGSCYRFLDGCMKEPWPRCLDWREVCDGKSDCLMGEDERWCQELEITECKENEYRCHYGGQCIPLDFAKDSRLSIDCLDGSDEQDFVFPFSFSANVYCTHEQTFNCQERTSRYRLSFPCGDGQYLFTFQLPNRISDCLNKRDIQYSRHILTSLNYISDIQCRDAVLCAIYSNRTEKTDLEQPMPVDTPPFQPIIDDIWEKGCEPLSEHCSKPWVVIPENPTMFGYFQFVYFTNRSIDEFRLNAAPDFACFDAQKCPVLLTSVTPINIIENLTCCHISNLTGYAEYTNLDDLVSIFAHLNVKCLKTGMENTCKNSSYFHCNQSLKCIPYHHVGDGQIDCFFAEDENFNACHLNDSKRFICKSNTDICLSPVAVANGISDCPMGEDEMYVYTFDIAKLIPFAILCNDIYNYDASMENMFVNDETNCHLWPCDNAYTHCDNIWHCCDGADELNCSNSLCSYDEFECISTSTTHLHCLAPNQMLIKYVAACDYPFQSRQIYFYNGSKYLGNDYLIWNDSKCIAGEELCRSPTNSSLMKVQSDIYLHECNQLHRGCSTTVHFMENTEHTCNLDSKRHRSMFAAVFFKSLRLGYFPPETKHHSTPIVQQSSQQKRLVPQVNPALLSYCRRGIPILYGVNQTIVCLCPPNYFGAQCQWQNQRVSLTLQFIWRNLTSTNVIFQAIIMIIDENGVIAPNHERITYMPSRDCDTKFNLYLLYPDRPKNSSRQYSIRIDLFEKVDVNYWSSWNLAISFPFLPVNRISTQLRIPGVRQQQATSCSLSCGEHGTCMEYINQNSSFFCRCEQGYSGARCNISHQCKCASGSFCLSPLICVCPLYKYGSYCYLKHSTCKLLHNPCQHSGICVPHDDRIDVAGFSCICSQDYSGPRCENVNNRIDISIRDIAIKEMSVLFIHFVAAFPNAEHERTTILRKVPYNQNSLTVYVSQPFNILLVEIPTKSYYLAILRETFVPSEYIHTKIQSQQKCTSISNLLDPSLVNSGYLNRTKYYPLLCRQNKAMMCFYDNDLICICDLDRFSNCFSFNHTMRYDCQGYNYCENGGQCFQNSETCPTKSTCVCQDCYYGAKCQFSTKDFLLSLDPILGYHIKPNVPVYKQPIIIKISIALSTTILVLGSINGILSITVFRREKPRKVGSGYYLLFSSFSSLCMLIALTIKFWQLLLSQMFSITNYVFLMLNCVSLNFLIKVFLASNAWLNACVAIERMISVTRGTQFDKQKSKTLSKSIVTMIFMVTTLTQIHDPIHRQLIDDVDEDERRIWCLVRYSSSMQIYNSFINLFHFLAPFSINVIAALLMIKKIARRRVNIYPQQTYQAHLQRQVYRHQHLLYAPCMLILLSLPRLIISFSKRCMKSAREPWFSLIGYFISFVPSMLTFVVFVLPSENYKSEFRSFYSQIIRRLRRY